MQPEEITRQIIEQSNQIVALVGDMKSLWKRLDELKALTETVHALALSLRDLTNAQQNTSQSIAGLRKDVDELQSKPTKRWEGIVTTIITSFVTAVITFLITRMGLK